MPCAAPASSTAKASAGRSSDGHRSASSSATRSGVAWVPSMISAALPWINSKAANARRETMTMVTSSIKIRLHTYFMASSPLRDRGKRSAAHGTYAV